MASKYLKASIVYQVADDSALDNARANISETYIEANTSSNTALEDSVEYNIADSGSQVVSFGGVTTIKSLFIKSSRQVSLKFNGSSTALPLGHTAGNKCWMCLAMCSVTSLTIENSSGGTAFVQIQVVGV